VKLKGVNDFWDVPGLLSLEEAKKKADRVTWQVGVTKAGKPRKHRGHVMRWNKKAEIVTVIDEAGEIVQIKDDMVEKL
jgi:hypothetical protein